MASSNFSQVREEPVSSLKSGRNAVLEPTSVMSPKSVRSNPPLSQRSVGPRTISVEEYNRIAPKKNLEPFNAQNKSEFINKYKTDDENDGIKYETAHFDLIGKSCDGEGYGIDVPIPRLALDMVENNPYNEIKSYFKYPHRMNRQRASSSAVDFSVNRRRGSRGSIDFKEQHVYKHFNGQPNISQAYTGLSTDFSVGSLLEQNRITYARPPLSAGHRICSSSAVYNAPGNQPGPQMFRNVDEGYRVKSADYNSGEYRLMSQTGSTIADTHLMYGDDRDGSKVEGDMRNVLVIPSTSDSKVGVKTAAVQSASEDGNMENTFRIGSQMKGEYVVMQPYSSDTMHSNPVGSSQPPPLPIVPAMSQNGPRRAVYLRGDADKLIRYVDNCISNLPTKVQQKSLNCNTMIREDNQRINSGAYYDELSPQSKFTPNYSSGSAVQNQVEINNDDSFFNCGRNDSRMIGTSTGYATRVPVSKRKEGGFCSMINDCLLPRNDELIINRRNSCDNANRLCANCSMSVANCTRCRNTYKHLLLRNQL